ncbi:MAG TPA: zinc ribbon domain-containing protein [Blastocatellia bacterium]|nr:zinc ribbon domain-containing protein [Blastocatellia bacterium]
MITCPNCGAGNKEGSSVCRLCGTSLEGHGDAPRAQAGSANPVPAAGSNANRNLEKEATDSVATEEIECPNCNTVNEAGWSFCQQCGKRLPQFSPPQPQWTPPPPPASRPNTEPVVDEGFRTTPTEVPAVEQSYKTVVAEPPIIEKRPVEKRPTEKPLPAPPTVVAEPPAPPRPSPPSQETNFGGGMATVVAEPPVTPEQKPAVPPPGQEPRKRMETVIEASAKPSANPCPQCGHPNNPGSAYCASCGAVITVAQTMIYSSPFAGVKGRLHLVMEGGQQGEVYDLGENTVIGRANGDITFPHDGFMSGKHARIVQQGGSFYLVDEGSRNGTFIKIKGEVELKPGDMILIGKQLFRFEQ